MKIGDLYVNGENRRFRSANGHFHSVIEIEHSSIVIITKADAFGAKGLADIQFSSAGGLCVCYNLVFERYFRKLDD
jgi:hypothetical protein